MLPAFQVYQFVVLFRDNEVVDCTEALGAYEWPDVHVSLVTGASLNNYVVDFFRHRDVHIISRDNDLADHKAYRKLSNFSSFLLKVSTSVVHGMGARAALSRTLTVLAARFAKYVNEIEY